MRKSKAIIFSILVHILKGLLAAFLTSLLVYFKQKELLHISVVLFLVSAIYFIENKLKSGIYFSRPVIVFAFACVLIIGLLSPQFIYQIRPFTFYISGIIIGIIAIFSSSCSIIDDQNPIGFSWKYIMFLIAFSVGYFVPWAMMGYTIAGFTLLMTAYFVIDAKSVNRLIILCTLIAVFASYYLFSKPMIYHDAQINYEDKVLYTARTQFHELVITQWQYDYWFFLDNLKNISSIDEYLFYEPMAHSVFKIGSNIRDVLIIGGENGCLIREVLKHKDVHSIDVINYDTLLRSIGSSSKYFIHMNQYAYDDPKVMVQHNDLINFISTTNRKYQAIFIDLPDPRSIETNQYYTIEFYLMIKSLLAADGMMITQAGSPYFASRAYLSIGKTLKNAGFNILPIHNQILTLGEWGWYVSSVSMEMNTMKERLINGKTLKVETKWFNDEAAKLVSAFGKDYAETPDLKINRLDSPWVYQYYLKGNWDLN